MSEGPEHAYPGIGRLHYFLAYVGMVAVTVLLVTMFGPGSTVMRIATLAMMVAGVILDVMRLRNIGVSQWFSFIRYLPFGGLVLLFGLTCAQTGWAETRRLDAAGKSILIVELMLLAVALFVMFQIGMSIFEISGF